MNEQKIEVCQTTIQLAKKMGRTKIEMLADAHYDLGLAYLESAYEKVQGLEKRTPFSGVSLDSQERSIGDAKLKMLKSLDSWRKAKENFQEAYRLEPHNDCIKDIYDRLMETSDTMPSLVRRRLLSDYQEFNSQNAQCEPTSRPRAYTY